MQSLDLTHTGLVVMGGAVALLLLGEWTGRRAVIWSMKPLASLGFLLVALGAGALGSTYGQILFAGLLLCLVGDLLLIPRARATFLGGLGAFLLGHVAFLFAFATLGVDPLWLAAALLALLPVRLLVLRWLVPHLPAPMRLPVELYAAVITLMLAFATGLLPTHHWLAFAGACLFYGSDLSVARDRFVHAGFMNRAWGLPAYYAGQALLALSVS